MGKSGVLVLLEYKSVQKYNIPEKRKDTGRGKVNYYGGPIGTHQRYFGPYHSRPLSLSFPRFPPTTLSLTQNSNHYLGEG